jgi:hypothetical protein
MTDEYRARLDAEVATPYKIYKKVILGKAYVEVLDPFSDAVVGLILEGDPDINDERCFIQVFDARQDLFFRRRNKPSIDSGIIIESKKPLENKPLAPYTNASDEELDELVKVQFIALRNALNSIESEYVVERVLKAANRMERGPKIIKAIEGRLAELQSGVKDEG